MEKYFDGEHEYEVSREIRSTIVHPPNGMPVLVRVGDHITLRSKDHHSEAQARVLRIRRVTFMEYSQILFNIDVRSTEEDRVTYNVAGHQHPREESAHDLASQLVSK